MENTTVVTYTPTLPIISHYKLPNTCFSSIFWLSELLNTPCMDPLSLTAILVLDLSEEKLHKNYRKSCFYTSVVKMACDLK